MARWEPWNIVGGAYTDDAKPWSVQDTVNYLVVRAERPGGRSTEMLRGVPGLALFSASLPPEPVRGLHNAEGRLFAVVGSTLYLIGTDGAATSLGTIPGVGRVTFAHNQVTGGNQVVIANGQSGYVYDTTTGALTQITDPGFPGFRTVDFADQYVHGPEPFGRYWHHSNLADATDFNTLDRYEAEKSPDRVMQTITTGPDILVLGERTGQFFYNTGAGTGTWANRQGAEFDRGAASPYTAVRIDNTVIWLGDDGSVYRLNGYSPARISTHALEQELSRGTLREAFAFAYEDRGHKCYLLTVPDGRTWCFDVATQEWTRRESYGLNRWRVSSLVKWQGAWIAGDYTNGKLYQLDWAVQTEAGDPLERGRVSGVLHDNQNALIVNGLELVFDTGMDASSPPLPQPAISPLSIGGDLPDDNINAAINYQYTVSGGVLPRAVSLLSGALPTGASINSAGLVTGTRTAGGVFSWTLRVTDADGKTADVADTSTTISDPLFAQVVSLLHFDGDNGGTVFTDVKGNTWTRPTSPTATTSTAQFKFGTASLSVPNSGNRWIETTIASFWQIGAMNATFECWARVANLTADQAVMSDSGAAPYSWEFVITTTGAVGVRSQTGGAYDRTPLSAAGVITANVWHHLAYVRSGTTTYAFVDGVLVATGTWSTDGNANLAARIGAGANTGLGMTGHVDDYRVTKNFARYTANFAPPTRAFPDA